MAKIPTMDEMAKQLAENALDNFLCNGKSLREWMKIIASEDAISRKEVLEWIKGSLEQYANTYSNDMLNMWMLFEEQIKALPPVTPTSSKMEQVEWVSTKDKMPKEQVEVLVTREFPDGRGGAMRVLEIASYGARRWSDIKCWITNDFRRYPIEEIVAWMPLPQIYKVESEDKE